MKVILDFVTNSSEADYYDCWDDCDCNDECDYDCDCDCDCDEYFNWSDYYGEEPDSNGDYSNEPADWD